MEVTRLSAEENRIVDIMERTCRAGDEYGCDFDALWDVIDAKDRELAALAAQAERYRTALEDIADNREGTSAEAALRAVYRKAAAALEKEAGR